MTFSSHKEGHLYKELFITLSSILRVVYRLFVMFVMLPLASLAINVTTILPKFENFRTVWIVEDLKARVILGEIVDIQIISRSEHRNDMSMRHENVDTALITVETHEILLGKPVASLAKFLYVTRLRPPLIRTGDYAWDINYIFPSREEKIILYFQEFQKSDAEKLPIDSVERTALDEVGTSGGEPYHLVCVQKISSYGDLKVQELREIVQSPFRRKVAEKVGDFLVNHGDLLYILHKTQAEILRFFGQNQMAIDPHP